MRTYESLRGSRLETVRENSRPPFAALQALRGRIADPLLPLPLKISCSVGRQRALWKREGGSEGAEGEGGNIAGSDGFWKNKT